MTRTHNRLVGSVACTLLAVGWLAGCGNPEQSPANNPSVARQASTAQTRTTVSGASVTQKSKAAAEAKATKAAQTQAKAAAQAKARAAAQAKARAAAQAKKLVPPQRAVHTGCFPKTNGGNCYEPGEFCRKSDRGLVGIAGDHVAIVCRDNDGLRWEPR